MPNAERTKKWIHLVGENAGEECTAETVYLGPTGYTGICDDHDRRVRLVDRTPVTAEANWIGTIPDLATVLVTLWSDGTATIAAAPPETHSWGAPYDLESRPTR